jgi:uncharacterized protein (TIGR03382 family)
VDRVRRAVIALALGLAVVPQSALANGRAPITNGVFFRPGNNTDIWVRTTFGLLVSHDDGCTFRWICEQNVGYGGIFDPTYAVAADGTIYATTYAGLRVSRDGGCTFTTATESLLEGTPGRIAGRYGEAIDVTATGDVWLGLTDAAMTNGIYRSTDAGETFQTMGTVPSGIQWKSLRVAPSDPLRIYATGFEFATDATAFFYRSVDGGAMWEPMPTTSFVFGSSPLARVVGVDPQDAAIVYVATIESSGPPNPGDRLYRSSDGGATFTEVLVTTNAITDVLVRGSSVIVATKVGGFTSTDRGVTFGAANAALEYGCLGERADGRLFACGANWGPDFKAIGQSADGASWDKLFRFVEMAGPVECPAGTPQADTCGPMWPVFEEQFGTKGPTCGANVVDAPPEMKPESGGCCDAVGGAGGSAFLGVLVGAGLLRRRRTKEGSCN